MPVWASDVAAARCASTPSALEVASTGPGSVADARRQIAELVLGAAPEPGDTTGCGLPGSAPAGAVQRDTATLGGVRLLPHQAAAVDRLTDALREFGGALLADEVGLGKTFVALAIASRAERPLVVAPSSLRAMWRDAMLRTGVHTLFRSMEGLSRAAIPPGDGCEPPCAGAVPVTGPHDLLVVDEAHHFRNRRTRRYDELARLASGVPVLLLSATPVHNRARDLHALLALFAGSAASALGEAQMARCIVRRENRSLAASHRPPVVLPPVWLNCGADSLGDALPDAILALPPPVPPSDGGSAPTLVARSLVRQWGSSVGALRAALRRRLMRAEVLLAHLEAGHHPSAAELREWAMGDDAVQLPIPGFFDDEREVTPGLHDTLVSHRDGVRALMGIAARHDDRGRAAALRDVRARHRGHGVVAFSQYADTVRALFALLAHDGEVCALHGDSATVSGGRLTREEALCRFAPRANGAREPPRAERITLLLTTDVASEGFNLQDAAAVVHLDLPWTPARMEQRVGRVARIGSPHQQVATYGFVPPPGVEELLGAERTLRAKWRVTLRTVGVGSTIPRVGAAAAVAGVESGIGVWAPDGGGIATATRAPSALDEQLRSALRRWLAPQPRPAAGCAAGGDEGCARAALWTPSTQLAVAIPDGCARAALCAGGDTPAFLAVILVNGRRRLLAGRSGGTGPAVVGDEPALLADVAAAVERATVAVAAPAGRRYRALRAIAVWASRRRASQALAVLPPEGARLRRELSKRLARVVRTTPIHARPAALLLVARARQSLARPLGAGTERALAALATAPIDDATWLRELIALTGHDVRRSEGEAPRARRAERDVDRGRGADDRPRVVALLLLVAAGDLSRPPG